MNYNPNIHHRRSIRLKGYDYSQAGAYFITICTKNRECLFGKITDAKMLLNEAGKIADEYLNNIPNHFSHIEMGEFIVMPNHAHCILVLHDKPNNVGTPQQPNANQFSQPIAGSVSVIIQQYKSSVKRWCNKNNHNNFEWQSRFHDHVIRDNQSYQTISDYIINNPTKWNKDKFFMEQNRHEQDLFRRNSYGEILSKELKFASCV